MNRSSIQQIYLETKSAVQLACGDNPVFYDALNFINTQNFSGETINEFTGGVPQHENLLCSAISKIPDTPLFSLKSALMAGYNQLQWRVDEGGLVARMGPECPSALMLSACQRRQCCLELVGRSGLRWCAGVSPLGQVWPVGPGGTHIWAGR